MFIFSSADVAFPEVTVCPSMKYAYKWNTLCSNYDFCKSKESTGGNAFPLNIPNPNVTLSSYFEDITYNLDELIFGLKIITEENNVETHNK